MKSVISPGRSLVGHAPSVLLGLLVFLVSAGTFAGGASASSKTSATSWIDEPVSFFAGGIKIYATYRHPVDAGESVPAVLLIAGSGPTDRNGNSPLETGSINTLKTLADWLGDDGVASLRYDKLGSGQTGLGSYATNVDSIGILPYEQESVAALKYLAAQKGIDDQRLAVFGHSEGALYALLMATGHAGAVPRIHALGLFEPLGIRYLDLIAAQVDAQVAVEAKAGQITKKLEATVKSTLKKALARLRSTGKVAVNLPYGLNSILSPSDAKYLYEADQYDPGTLAAALPAHTPVIVSCSEADIQVSCSQSDHIVKGLSRAGADTDYVHLKGIDHVLKVDASGTSANYTKDLPFSPVLKAAIQKFVSRNL
jgi:hypothetical protein